MSDGVMTTQPQSATSQTGSELAARPVSMSYEEYLALPNDGRLIEWVNGEVIYHMPPITVHQIIATYLTTLLNLFTEFFNLGRVVPAAFEMKCWPGGSSREPDLIYVSTANLRRLDDKRLTGPADLVVEIVSDDSVSRDYDEKFVEYQECGVPEYWLIDPRPRRQRALFYQLDDEGKYDLVKPANGVYRSKAVSGFWLKVAWIWARPDPQLTFGDIAGFPQDVIAVLKEKKQRGLE